MDFFLALVGGFLSFASPCVFPLIPAYIAFITGVSIRDFREGKGDRKIAFIYSFIFVVGFSLAFTLLGASASFVGKLLKSFKTEFRIFAGIILLLFGFQLIGILKVPFLLEERKIDASRINYSALPRHLISFISGFLFAFGWTSCIGPILAGILALAASSESLFKGSLLLFIYSLGIGIPFMLSALFVSYFLSFSAKMRNFFRWVEVSAGVLLILMGMLFITGRLSYLSSLFPDFQLENLIELSDDIVSDDDVVKSVDEKLSSSAQKIFEQIFSGRITPVNGIEPMKGDFVIVNVWATWCPPCKVEIPDFVRAISSIENLSVIGLAYDDGVVTVRKFISEMGINYPVFMFSDVAEKFYEPDGLPESFFFHKGKFIGRVVGIVDMEYIRSFVNGKFEFIKNRGEKKE